MDEPRAFDFRDVDCALMRLRFRFETANGRPQGESAYLGFASRLSSPVTIRTPMAKV
jgi:hypothetical protein